MLALVLRSVLILIFVLILILVLVLRLVLVLILVVHKESSIISLRITANLVYPEY